MFSKTAVSFKKFFQKIILSAPGMQFDNPARKILSKAPANFQSQLEKICSDSCTKIFLVRTIICTSRLQV